MHSDGDLWPVNSLSPPGAGHSRVGHALQRKKGQKADENLDEPLAHMAMHPALARSAPLHNSNAMIFHRVPLRGAASAANRKNAHRVASGRITEPTTLGEKNQRTPQHRQEERGGFRHGLERKASDARLGEGEAKCELRGRAANGHRGIGCGGRRQEGRQVAA